MSHADSAGSEVSQTLRRIRKIIGDAVRSVQCGQSVDHNQLISAKNNLNRISPIISTETFNGLEESLNDLMIIYSTKTEERYVSDRISKGGSI